MYRVSEVATLLSVEKTDIYEKMISHKSLIDPNVKKSDGITYITERGLEILGALFSKEIDKAIKKDVVKNRQPSKFEKDRTILYNKIAILKTEIKKLDKEMIEKTEEKRFLFQKLEQEYTKLIEIQKDMLHGIV